MKIFIQREITRACLRLLRVGTIIVGVRVYSARKECIFHGKTEGRTWIRSMLARRVSKTAFFLVSGRLIVWHRASLIIFVHRFDHWSTIIVIGGTGPVQSFTLQIVIAVTSIPVNLTEIVSSQLTNGPDIRTERRIGQVIVRKETITLITLKDSYFDFSSWGIGGVLPIGHPKNFAR